MIYFFKYTDNENNQSTRNIERVNVGLYHSAFSVGRDDSDWLGIFASTFTVL